VLFDLVPYTPPADDHGASPLPPAPPTAVSSWIRGVFRYGDGEERIRSVAGQTLAHHRDADIERFTAYLMESGRLFPEGRAVLTELLGIGAYDGTEIHLSHHSVE
jgi:hypothetical protein